MCVYRRVTCGNVAQVPGNRFHAWMHLPHVAFRLDSLAAVCHAARPPPCYTRRWWHACLDRDRHVSMTRACVRNGACAVERPRRVNCSAFGVRYTCRYPMSSAAHVGPPFVWRDVRSACATVPTWAYLRCPSLRPAAGRLWIRARGVSARLACGGAFPLEAGAVTADRWSRRCLDLGVSSDASSLAAFVRWQGRRCIICFRAGGAPEITPCHR